MFDVVCPQGHEGEQFAWRVTDLDPCVCGAPVSRVLRPSRVAVIPDSFVGGATFEHLAATPQTFYSRTEKRAYLKAHGIREAG